MGEPELTHEVVSLKGRFQIIKMDPEGTSHEHMLWSFNDLVICFKKV
jgi:hypothetical protein